MGYVSPPLWGGYDAQDLTLFFLWLSPTRQVPPPWNTCPPTFLPQGESGKTQQHKDVQERELQARNHEIHDLKTTVALLHARIDHQQRQTSDQVRG